MPATSNFRFFWFSTLSARFPDLSWSGRVQAAPEINFPAPESIFHDLELNFDAQNRFFVARNQFFSPRRWVFFGFRLFFVVREGPGVSRDLFSCSGIDSQVDFSFTGLDCLAG